MIPNSTSRFESIDPVINEWAAVHRLTVFREYKEIEVRDIEFADRTGLRRVQLWIEPPENGRTHVNVWEIDRKNAGNAIRIPTETEDLRAALDEALTIVKGLLDR